MKKYDLTNEIKKNMEFECKIVAYNSTGEGITRINGRAVFVPNTLVDEEHLVRILKVTNTAVYGKSMRLLKSCDSRIEPECKYYYSCGGCTQMHMTYAEELKFKLNKVNDALKHIGKQNFYISDILPSEKIHRYRNKVIFNVDGDKIGFYRQRTHDLVEVDDCLLQPKEYIEIANEIKKTGLNHIFIRNKICTIAGPSYDGPIPNNIDGLVICNNKRDNSVLNGDFKTIYGNADQLMELCGFKFRISPQSFFQINQPQAEKLYNTAVEFAGQGQLALELYCGAGTISHCLSKTFKKVIACEIVPEAINNAKENAVLNNVSNIDFYCCDAKEMSGFKPDVVLVDPPRKGLSIDAVELLKNISADKVVYISCNPSTLARDIQLLSDVYTIEKGVAVDMFPRTYHVESVVLLTKVHN